MQTPLAEYKKNIVSISQFGGYNHTDFTRVGEWFDMKNLSDRYTPLLAPRKSRRCLATLPAAADEVLLKNGVWYYTAKIEPESETEPEEEPGEEVPEEETEDSEDVAQSDEYGIFCYAPDGNNPFSLTPTTEPVCVYQSARQYKILEMGNRVIGMPTDGSDNAVSLKGGKVKLLGYNEQYKYTSNSYAPESRNVLHPIKQYAYGLANTDCVYTYDGETQEENFSVAKTQDGNYCYDEHAKTLLNIGFTYATENDDGTFDIYDNEQAKKSASQVSSTQYFMDSASRYYYYDALSDSTTEITAPYLVILFHRGEQPQAEQPFPALEEGDYILLSVGKTTNAYQPLYATDNVILDKQLARVKKCFAFSNGSVFQQRGWTHGIIVDYNATFAERLRKKDLIFHSVSFKRHVMLNPLNAREGNQITQLYPESFQIENAFPVVTVPLEHNNRIWAANNENNEIKASAQGNFEVWDDYRGLVSDSYAVSVGSNDKFTASCAIDDYLFFFKEHSYTLVYGTRPANFTTNTVKEFIGISADSACSLQVIGKSAYYMGIDGRVYRFNGQSSVCISGAWGDEQYTPLSSAHTAEKYRLLVEDKDHKRLMFVYNTETGMWWVEDAAEFEKLTNIQGRACALTGVNNEDGAATEVVLLDKWDVPEHENNQIEWSCESGLLGLESDYYQYISNLKLTFESEVGARLDVYAKFDNETDYNLLASFVSEKKGTRCEKIHIRRCAFMRLKLKGKGFSKIFRISYLTAQGGEK